MKNYSLTGIGILCLHPLIAPYFLINTAEAVDVQWQRH